MTIGGVWDFHATRNRLKSLASALHKQRITQITFANDAKIDLAFGIFLKQHLQDTPEIIASEQIQATLSQCLVAAIPPTPKRSFIKLFFAGIGRSVYEFFQSFVDFLNFVGMSFYYLVIALFRGDIRFTPLLYHINESGFKALPVSLLTAFIVGFAIALQGAVQLELMGAPLLSIEMTAKLSLREMGPFILALVIAGRSASSFTAEIGVMRLTDELDAMKTMNFHPVPFLVIPRLFALILVMPLLVFLADAFSLLGGMLAVYLQLGIDMGSYIDRVYETVSWTHFFIGIVKAPFFGAAIALVGCFRGFCIKENTQELGRITTISVVNALFWIIAINAIFSFITSRLEI